mgnify:CR=1 FL=1
MNILDELEWRGAINQQTDEDGLRELTNEKSVALYCGIDPSGDSMHVGHLIPFMILKRFQLAGHRPVIVIGGGTGSIGDPSGRNSERVLQTMDKITENAEKLSSQMRSLFEAGSEQSGIKLVNNYDWLSELSFLDFLRDYGKEFNINTMLAKDVVANRMDTGISFTEFSYQIIQSVDFLHLFQNEDVQLQIGGSDQWGNIINGIDLTRRSMEGHIFGLTSPLLTTSDGKKMGKSQDGAVWLNADMRSPYEFWQFWRNTADADVGRFLKLYTEVPLEECDKLGTLEGSDINDAKIILANEVTTLLHGAEAAANAQVTAREVFEKGGIGDDLPTVILNTADVSDAISVAQLIVRAGLVKSGKEAKRLIAENGARLNDAPLSEAGQMIEAEALKNTIKLSAGKKRHVLVRLKN